jgi:hypothetical protein
MDVWVIVCWAPHKPRAGENIRLGGVYRAESLCRKAVQETKDILVAVPPLAPVIKRVSDGAPVIKEVEPRSDCSCFCASDLTDR